MNVEQTILSIPRVYRKTATTIILSTITISLGVTTIRAGIEQLDNYFENAKQEACIRNLEYCNDKEDLKLIDTKKVYLKSVGKTALIPSNVKPEWWENISLDDIQYASDKIKNNICYINEDNGNVLCNNGVIMQLPDYIRLI